MEGTICMLFSCAGRPDRHCGHCASSGFKVQDATARTLVRQKLVFLRFLRVQTFLFERAHEKSKIMVLFLN
jgi:hypothetical protein